MMYPTYISAETNRLKIQLQNFSNTMKRSLWHSHEWLEKMARLVHWLELDHLLLSDDAVVEVGVVVVEDRGGGDREDVHTVGRVILVLVGARELHVLAGDLARGHGFHSINSTPATSKQPTELFDILICSHGRGPNPSSAKVHG